MTQVNLSKGLLGYWTFDDVDVDSERNRLRDRSGRSLHAEIEGGVTTGVNSPVGEGFSFSGDDGQLCRVPRPHPFDGSHSALSVIAIFNPESITGGIISSRTSNTGSEFSCRLTSGSFRLDTNIDDEWYSQSVDISSGDWTVGFVEHDREAGECRVEAQGTVNYMEVPSGPPTHNDEDISIGANHDEDSMVGELGMVMMHNRTYTESEREYAKQISDRMVSQL